jgi:hypothetical protein
MQYASSREPGVQVEVDFVLPATEATDTVDVLDLGAIEHPQG